MTLCFRFKSWDLLDSTKKAEFWLHLMGHQYSQTCTVYGSHTVTCTYRQLSPVGTPPAPAFCRINIELFADAPFGDCGGTDDGIHNSKRDTLIFESKFKWRYSLKYNLHY